MSIRHTIESVLNDGYVDHIHDNGRTVAIRPEYKRDKLTGRVNLTFSDGQADIRGAGDTKYSLTVKQAERAISVFLNGQRVKLEHGQCDLFINQAVRWCIVDKTTPARLRLTYDMPNAGEMGGWWKYVTVSQFTYVTNC